MKIDFEGVLSLSPNAYVILDREFTIVWANAAYSDATMRSLDEIEGRKMFDAFPSEGESYRMLRDSFERVFATGEPDELAHIRYDIPNQHGSVDVHYWSATHTPLKNDSGHTTHLLQHTVEITELERLRRMRDAMGVMERARAVEQRYQTAAQEAARLRDLLEQAPGFVAILSGSDHRFVMANAAYRRLLGERALIDRTVGEAMPEVVEQGFVDILDSVTASGEPYIGERERVVLVDPSDEQEQERFLEFIFQPIKDSSGGVSGVFVQGYDVTEEVAADERRTVLINELNHRVKNTLAVVQSLAQQSFRGDDPDRSLNVFNARLSALSSAHNLLTECNWRAADLAHIVRSSLEATVGQDVDRYALSGRSVMLEPQNAVAMAMIVHELATNALKHGALSTDTGTIQIEWSADDEGETVSLCFDWVEQGGPPVVKPERHGFGSRLIGRGLGGPSDRATLEFDSSGVHYHLEAVL